MAQHSLPARPVVTQFPLHSGDGFAAPMTIAFATSSDAIARAGVFLKSAGGVEMFGCLPAVGSAVPFF
jgi:hypothetical protein